MACGKCPKDKTQMKEVEIEGEKMCKCPVCGEVTKVQGIDYSKSPKPGWLKTMEGALNVGKK